MQREFIATLDWVQIALTDKDKKQHWQRWQKELSSPSKLLYTLSLLPDLSTVAHLPPLSFILRIPFKLQKPYLSKDDCDFYLLDNPLRKEKVFQTPMVASTSWKGALRAAFWQLGYKEEHEGTLRLFGNPRGSDEHQAGRLYFFPTFFESIALEVINPHDRQNGAGARGPILMECVPAGAPGAFTLLYVPFGPLEQDEDQKRAEVAEDLRMLAQGLQAMLTTYGFGAKTSSGFGVAEDQLAGEGKLAIRAELASKEAATPITDLRKSPVRGDEAGQLQTDIEQFVARFGLPGFPKWTDEELDHSDWGKKRQSEYKRLRLRHPDWDDTTRSWRTEPEGSAPIIDEAKISPALTETPPVTNYTFRSLSDLCDLAQRVAEQLQERGAQ